MVDLLILGSGNVGRTVAYDMFEEHQITMADADENALKNIEKDEHLSVQETTVIDAEKRGELKDLIEDHDVVVGSLPGDLGYQSIEAAAEAGTDMVDVSFMPEEPFSLDELAKDNDISVVVDAGFGPGMSNLFMGRIQNEMDVLEEAVIRIGGLPLEPQPPLYHKLTFSPHDLIQEYVREARIMKGGKVVKKYPMEDIDQVELDGKKFEEFYSDGLRTLLETIEVRDLEETTLRWSGHLEKMKVLKDLGFFKEDNVEKTLDVIGPSMRFESRDFCILNIEAKGKISGEEREIHYFFYDEADERFSSMARSTGYSAAAFTRLLIDKKEDIKEGIVPPEYLGMEKGYHDFAVEHLREKGIEIEISKV